MPRLCLVAALVLTLGSCVWVERGEIEIDEALLDGTLLFGHPVAAAAPVDFMAMTAAMRAFVGQGVANSSNGYLRFQRLMGKLAETERFAEEYERDSTYTAAQAFEERTGNCLAYTAMFVALARHARLNAHFQIVRVAPAWDVDAELLIRNNHVNVVVKGLNVPGQFRSELTVDFNEIQADEHARTQVITDDYARSMYYGNVAIDHLQAGELEGSFAYLKLAILTEPENPDPWNNLGTLYALERKYELAQRVFEMVLEFAPRNKTAVVGMANALTNQGDLAAAAPYDQRARKERRRNPYYHYALAKAAYRQALYEEALTSVQRAIELERDNARFYHLRAATALALGDTVLAEESVELAIEHQTRELGEGIIHVGPGPGANL